jgi:hypothetical protein
VSAVEHWFENVGSALSQSLAGAVATMLGSQAPYHRAEIVVVAHWHEVAAAVRAEDRDSDWWDFEEEERERLWDRALLAHTEDQLLESVGRAASERRPVIDAAVQAASARLAIADPAWGGAARAAALLAVHQHALAAVAETPPEHWFVLKHRLFAEGRWPLGVRSGRFLIY